MMRNLFLFLLFYVLPSRGDKSSVSLALREIISEFYVNRSERFDLIAYGAQEKLREVVNEIGKVKSMDLVPCKVSCIVEAEAVVEINQSAILLFDTFDSYHHFHTRATLTNKFPKQFHFLVYIQEIDDTLKHSLINPSALFRFESFLMPESGDFQLVSFLKFQQPNCRDWIVTEINRFSQASRKWAKREFFIEKFHNFNGCELIVRIPYPSMPAASVDFDQNGVVTKISGYAVMFNALMGEALKYSYKYNPFNLNTQEYYAEPINFDISLQTLTLRILQHYLDKASLTQTFTSLNEVILISKSDHFTPQEKRFLPFDRQVWNWLIATLIISLVTILFMNYSPWLIKSMIIGSYSGNRSFDLLTKNIGGNNAALPGRKFARFMCVVFALYCFEMQLAYQIKQFEFRQNEMRKPNVETIDEMIDNNFSLFMPNDTGFYMQDMDFIKHFEDNRVESSFYSRPEFYEDLLEDGSRRGLVVDSDTLDTFLRSNQGEVEFTKLKQLIITNHVGFVMPTNHFMYDAFNKKITQMVESGLANMFVRKFANPYQIEKAKKGPDVLTLNHLGFAFKAWLVFLVVSLLCFLVEFLPMFLARLVVNRLERTQISVGMFLRQ